MSTEQNKAMAQRFYDEVISQGQLHVLDQITARSYVDHDRDNPTHDVEGSKRFFAMVRSAFPDVSATVEDLIAEGDRVVARTTIAGTHRGEWMGTPPTGRRFVITCIDIMRYVDGKVVEHWSEGDTMGMLQQLGLFAAPGPE